MDYTSKETKARKAAMIAKLKNRANSIEVRDMDGERLIFDHSTGNMMQFGFDVYGNGYTQSWARRGYSIESKYNSFREF